MNLFRRQSATPKHEPIMFNPDELEMEPVSADPDDYTSQSNQDQTNEAFPIIRTMSVNDALDMVFSFLYDL